MVSVFDMAEHDYTSTFSRQGVNMQGPVGTFDLIKTSNVYLLPVNSQDDRTVGGGGANALLSKTCSESTENGRPI